MKKDACVFLQVELLIENEAEKDYLYDVLRLYHRWVPSVTAQHGFIVVITDFAYFITKTQGIIK